jgi:protein arginine kinase
MKYEGILHSIPSWMNPEGPESGMVISSRARLARNVSGFPYAHRADADKLHEVVDMVLDASEAAGFDRSDYFPNEDLDDLKKAVFLERHLISHTLSEKNRDRGVLVRDGEGSSILVNEEDHLRIQSFCSGFDPMRAWEEVDSIDDRLCKSIPYSFSKKYGYLTACPTNIGTGLRVSILIHLPALVLTNDVPRMIRSASQIGLAVRGYFGEGSDVVGNLFQISNRYTLGKTERDSVEELIRAAGKIIDYEKRAAATLMKEARNQIEDKIFRSVGILKSARVLSTGEFMNLTSAVRLGLFLDILAKPDVRLLNELLVINQPGHLQGLNSHVAEAMERDVMRANLVRERFIDVRI